MNQIGQYKILREIGRGGMATVYLVRDSRDNQVYALKVLPVQFTHDPQFKDRFLRECKTVAKLKHDAIVPVYDYGEEAETPYLVMRYMSGGTLADRLAQGPVEESEAIRIMRPIAAALDYAHSQGIVHRDVKPGNIYFDEKGDAFLGDFGIVQLEEATRSFTGSAVVGTAAYMSPEQVKGGKKIDGRSDQYTLAIVLYEMLTGKAPYEGETPTQQMMKHVLEPVPRIREQNPQISPSLEQILMKGLAKDPQERYATVSEFIQSAETLALPTQPTLYGQPTRQYEDYTKIEPPPSSRKKPALLFAGLGVLLVVVLAVGAFVFLSIDDPFTGTDTPTEPSAMVLSTQTPEIGGGKQADILTENPEDPTPQPLEDVFTWQTVDGIIVLERGVEYWEKYQMGSAHPGLYLRTDTVASFGDFLELNADETYLLDMNGESTSGTWKVEGDQLVLNP